MGNHRFRFSNMIPNSWFYFYTSNTGKKKLTNTQPITTSSSSSPVPSSQPVTHQRKSYHFTREFVLPDPTTRIQDPTPHPEPTNKKRLPRIRTKPVIQDEFGSGKWLVEGGGRSLSVRVVTEGIIGSPVRKSKGKGYSPRLGYRVRVSGINGGRRRNGNRRRLSESLAVVKTSADPGRDFKESMVEMIRENNIKSSKDLEDLLACYLALNSDEYHDLIINVFKQIWFECTDIGQ